VPDPLRWTLSAVAAVAAAVLLAIATVGWWLRDTVLDTGTWVATVAPLAGDAAVQRSVSAYVTDQVLVLGQAVEAQAATGRPPNTAVAAFLTGPGRALVSPVVDAFVRSPAFASLWRETNRTVHAQVLALLAGRTSGAVQEERGRVVADLAPVVAAVVVELVDGQPLLRPMVPVDALRGALTPEQARTRLGTLVGAPVPADFGRVIIADADTLPQLRTATTLLSDGVVPVALVAAGLAVAAVVLAPRRAVGVAVVGALAALAALVALGLASLVSGAVVGQVGDPVARAAADATARIVTRRLDPTLELLAAGGVLVAGVAVGALVLGRSARARAG
jgi:hypothetical protein